VADGLDDLMRAYDLTKKEDVDALAVELGTRLTAMFVPIAQACSEEHRRAFFAYLFGAPVGAMTAAIGADDAEKVLQVLIETARGIAERRKRTLN
jgi:hypothetical protein